MLLFQPRTVFILCLLAAIGALGSAFIAQFGYGLKPCILCLWQRIPYAVIIPLTLLAAVLTPSQPKLIAPLLALTTLLFIASAGLGFFHFGVEQHWWSLEGGCPVQSLAEKSTDDVLKDLLATPQAKCDEVGWKLFGLSITVWNTAFSLAMAFYALLGLVLHAKRKV